MYKSYKNQLKNIVDCVVRLSDGALIPFAPDNTDYQAYLKYIAEGGVVLPADQEGVAP